MQWWCAARGIPWTWEWQPFPGVWLAVALAAWWTARRSVSPERWRRVSAWGAVVVLWITLDWPMGPVAAGYLSSVHALQFVSLAMVVPPLVLMGAPASTVRSRTVWRSPLAIAIAFTLVMVVTHIPAIVDGLMRSQLGSLALDALWLGSGLAFWQPVLAPRTANDQFSPAMRMPYLFLGTQAHLLIAMWLLTRDFPAYAIYEQAPRIVALSALQDQQVAGGVMILIAEPIVLLAISIIFFRWFQSDRPDTESTP